MRSRSERRPEPGPDREAGAFGLLGLARRAGYVVPGVDAVRKAVRAGKVCLVLVAEDGSRAQLEKALKPSRHRDVPIRTLGDQVGLGEAVGGPTLSVVAVTDGGFAEQLLRRLDGPEGAPSTPD